MKKISIKGNALLNGTVSVHGSKNAILPILAASILAEDKNNILYNCPRISDVENTIRILEYIGHKVEFENNTLKVFENNNFNGVIPDTYIRKMRSSILFMGALLNKYGYVKITLPGGCELGARPIDLHLKAFEQLGVVCISWFSKRWCYWKYNDIIMQMHR